MSKQTNKIINEVYVSSPNFISTYVQCSGDLVATIYTKDWFAKQLALDKILNLVRSEYPTTPVLLHDAGYLMFIDGNDEFADEMSVLFQLHVMKHERTNK